MTKTTKGKHDRDSDVGDVGKPKAYTTNGGYKVAVKRHKGAHKSENKNISYLKQCTYGCESTSLAIAIDRFERKHRRMATVDDVVDLFHQLNTKEEPHELILLHKKEITTSNNYYSRLEVDQWSFDDEPVVVEDTHYFTYVHRRKVKRIAPEMTFDEILEEHRLLLNLQQHIDIQTKFQERTVSNRLETMDRVFSSLQTPHSDEYCELDEDDTEQDCEYSTGVEELNISERLGNIFSELRPIIEGLLKAYPKFDKYIDFMEDLIFISYIICYHSDSNLLLGTLLGIYKRHAGGSLSASIIKFIHRLCANRGPLEAPQSNDYRAQVNKILRLNNTVLFGKVKDGLALCIALGFINPINVTIKNVKLFSCSAANIADKGTDFVTYVVDLLLYFFELGHQVFAGEYERLFDMTELCRIDDNLLHLRTYIDSIKIGSYESETGKKVEEYYAMLLETISSLKILTSSVRDRTYKALILSKLGIANQLLVTFDQTRPLSGLRESPFSLCFYGGSSVGKTSSSKMILTSLLSFNGKSCGDEHICTIQPTDKFYSTYKSNVTGVIVDDLCNTRYEKAVVDPAALLISLVNNVPYYAPKAESFEKGRVSVRPNIVVVTTNKLDLEAEIWSNEPISVVRRLKYYVIVKVKDQYKTNNGLDSSKVGEDQVAELAQCGLQDLWWFDLVTVTRYDDGGYEKYKFDHVKRDGKELVNLDIYELLRILNIESRNHFEQQAKFVEGCKNSGLRHQTCNVCCYPKTRCSCERPDDAIQGGLFSIVDDFCTSLGQSLANYVLYSWNRTLPNTIERALYSPALKLALLKYMQGHYLSIMNYIPYSLRKNKYVRRFHLYVNRRKMYYMIGFGIIPTLGMCLYKMDFKCDKSIIQWSYVGVATSLCLYKHQYNSIMADLDSKPLATIVPLIQSHQSLYTIFKVGLTVTGVVVALKVFRTFYTNLRNAMIEPEKETEDSRFSDRMTRDADVHGNLSPTNYSDILERDAEVNIWSKKAEKFVPNINTSTMTTQQLLNVVSSCVLNLVMEVDEMTGSSIGCVALKSNIFCCPLHFFKEDKNIYGHWKESNVRNSDHSAKNLYKLKFIKHDGDNGNKFTATIDRNDIVQLEGLDLCVFKVNSGGTFCDLTKFCVFNQGEANTVTLKRDRFGTLHIGNARVKHQRASYTLPSWSLWHKTFEIQGGRAHYGAPTANGDCMMMHIRDSKEPSIIGFHISGSTGTNLGSYTMFKPEQLQKALKRLDEIHDVFTPHAGSYFDVSRLGTTILIQEDIPEKAPVNYIKEHNYLIRGTVGTQSSYFTEIRRTYMCTHVEQIFGIDNIWRGPKFGPQRWKPWYTFLSSSVANDCHMDTSLLKLAKHDYLSPLKDKLKQYDEFEQIRPLEHMEIINGIPGKRFIDHINFKSSIGYPLTGKKYKYMQGEPMAYDFNTSIFEIEYEKMKAKYLSRERYYPIFKASLKDEPVKMDKDKVRVFQAADITLQYGWRKYGLPILRFLSLHPLISECAVGINPYNDEWDQMHNFVTFNGEVEDRIIAGDYKTWDQKLPATLVMAAFDVIVTLASLIPSYSEEDLLIVKGLATDTVYYLSNFNGTLIEFTNGLPSGHNLTAHINSIANSLLLRYGYYLYKNPAPFRLYCHAITYGDDFQCGASRKVTKFDHVLYKKVVEDVGMLLTMPDKTSEPIPFLHIVECDFLKRRSIKCNIDGKYYGALDFNSMLRSLMVRGKTNISEKDHAYSVIRGFLHDLSFHTEMVYESNVGKIRELLAELNLVMPEACMDYEEYYNFRNGLVVQEECCKLDTLDSATASVGYPMTPEASDDSENFDYYVSSSDHTSAYECIAEEGATLAEHNYDYSYLGAKIPSDSESRYTHDDEIQSEVFGASEDNLTSNVVSTGTAILTSSAEHSMQTLNMVGADTLSLRQDATRSLAEYLSRPRSIWRINPDTDATPSSIAPLLAFLSTNLIRDKIRNYAYINGVLHIKAVVVGSPTMAGCQILALHPWHLRDNGLGKINFDNYLPDLTQMSQLPCILTDLSREKGGEISLPIICPSNGLDITTLDQISDAFGLHYMPVTATNIQPNSRIRPHIVVYAWMTDVKLTGTTLSAELPQGDEYHTKPHEKPSSDHISIREGVSKAAGTIVGKATELGVSKAMAAMGFSNPLDPGGFTPNVPKLHSNMSTYNAPVNIDTLAADIKNEVALDSRLLGFEDQDHMNLNNILSRWSIVNSIQMAAGVYGSDVEAYNLPVTPMACRVITVGSTSVFTPTALSMAALPFNRWRGTITYRFQAVGTAFMKGKIKISHDVKTPTSITPAQKSDTQILNSVIWDLASTNVIEVRVPWASNQVFKQCGLLRQAVLPYGLTNTTPLDADANGSLVMSPYTTINDMENTFISIIVSIKGEPGMVFGDMRAVLANYAFAGINNNFNGDVPQSEDFSAIDYMEVDYVRSSEDILYLKDGRIYPINLNIWVKYFANKRLENLNSINNDSPQSLVYEDYLNKNILTGDNPGSILSVNINGLEENLDDHDDLVMLCMGEKFYSLRQIIKRYTHNWTRNYSFNTNVLKYLRIRLPDRPLIKGWQGSASVGIQPNNIRVTYARDSFLSFYSMAFLGYRGSLRHKIMVKSTHNSTSYADQPTFSVTRSSGGYVEEIVNIGATSQSMTTASVSASASAIPYMVDFRAGGALGYSHINPVLEYSTPYYSRGKFCWAQDRYPQVLKNTPDGGYDVPWHQIAINFANTTSFCSTRIDKFVAAGDDFSLFFYLYGPRMVLDQPTSWPQ